MSTRQPGTGGSSIMASNIVAFTTADADIASSTYTLDGISFPAYLHGLIDGDVTTAQSADLSKGNGFLAAAIEGGFSILDANGLIAKDIAGAHVNPIGWDIWLGYIPAGGTYVDIVNLGQFQSVDLKVADGMIQVVAKSPAYLGNQPLYGIRTATQLDTDPVDPSNPTDPTYLRTSVVSQFAGMAFGSQAVSLKAGDSLPVETLARWGETAIKQGQICDDLNTITGKICQLTADYYNRTGNLPEGGTTPSPILEFWCKDSPELARLDLLIHNSFLANDYRIILSDGTWFLDISTMVSPYTYPTNYTNVTTSKAHHAMRFYLTDPNGVRLTPLEDIDPTQVKMYAVPSSVAISAGQYVVDGLAFNGRSIPLAAKAVFDGANLVLRPEMATESDFISIISEPKIGIGFSEDIPAGTHIGAIEITDGAISALSDFGTSTGRIQDIVTDPTVGWNGGTVPVNITDDHPITALDSHPLVFRMRCRPMQATNDAAFFCVDTTYKITITAGSTGTLPCPMIVAVSDIFGPDQTDFYSFSITASGQITSVSRKAPRSISSVDWLRRVETLDAMVANLAPKFVIGVNDVSPAVGDTFTMAKASVDIMEAFVWAFRKIGFSAIYSTVYPFWTRGSCANLATDGAGNVMAAATGLGVVAADGSINWSALTLSQPNAGAVVYTGQAFGAATLVSVGIVTPTTGAVIPSFWAYAGGTWTPGTFSGTARPTRVRYLGTKFVATFDDGTIRTSTNGTSWSGYISTGASILYDIAFDGTNYIAVGTAGHIYKSTNLTSWTNVTASGITGIVYGIAWLASGSGGAIYVACGAGGKAYYANQTQALAGTWTAVALGSGGDSIDAIGVTTTGSNAILSGQTTTGFKIWSTGDGVSYGVAFSDNDDSMGGINGYGSGVVYTTSGWVVGTESGNIITSIHGGQPVPSTWIPWGTSNPKQALANLRGRYFGGMRKLVYGGTLANQNPVQWTGGKFYVNLQTWGIAFDPPTSTMNDYSGTNADAAARKIASEWWAFAGEMPSTVLDGSNDSIEEHFPELALGNIEDVATIITVQYQPFGGKYLGAAYIQNVNVDRATAGKPDAFFFAGWDSSGNTNGLALWTLCRNIFLKTGILRATSLTFDSIHDADTLGILWTTVDPDLGTRMRWLCDRPRYLKLIVNGNDSKAAQAQCGCRYKPNTAMLDGRQMPALNSTGYGVVVQADHNYTQGTHVLDIAFPPA
jgi:hypothetical protein